MRVGDGDDRSLLLGSGQRTRTILMSFQVWSHGCFHRADCSPHAGESSPQSLFSFYIRTNPRVEYDGTETPSSSDVSAAVGICEPIPDALSFVTTMSALGRLEHAGEAVHTVVVIGSFFQAIHHHNGRTEYRYARLN